MFGQSYVAFVSSCDGLAAFLREKPDHTAVDYFQGLDQFWQPGLPIQLPAYLCDEVRSSTELIEHKQKIKEATNDTMKDRATKDYNNAVRRLEKQALDLLRAETIKELRRHRLMHGTQSNITNEMNILNEVIPEKRRIAHAIVSEEPMSRDQELDVMQDMLYLLTTSWSVFYRHGEAPNDQGACPFCGKKMER